MSNFYRGCQINFQEDYFNTVCQATIPGGYWAMVPHSALGFLKLIGETEKEVADQIDEILDSKEKETEVFCSG